MIIPFTKSSLPFGWMGNMCGIWKETPLIIEINGYKFKSSENLFQAMRFGFPNTPEQNMAIVEQIINTNGMDGKRIAKNNKDKMVIEPMSWLDVKNMFYVTFIKLKQHSLLLNELLTIGINDIILEDVQNRIGGKNDSSLFWGGFLIQDKILVGLNYLGIIYQYHRKNIESMDYKSIDFESLDSSLKTLQLLHQLQCKNYK